MEKESKSNFFSRLFLFIIYGGFLFAVYIFINRSPCDKPITYSIGRVDGEFGISKSDVQKYTNNASNIWNKALNKNLLSEATSSKITINFIFDERQRATIQAQKLKAEIEEQKNNLNNLKNNIDILRSEYDTQKSAFDLAQTDYNSHLTTYNNEVTIWNKKGGAPKDIYDQLTAEKISLDNKYNQLNISINELQRLANQINTLSQTHNNIVSQVNTTISSANQNSGKQFEEGVYDPNNKTITIYEYDSINSLKRVLAHELGHALGIDHVQNKASIMYYLNNSNNLKPTTEDVSALQKICKIKKII